MGVSGRSISKRVQNCPCVSLSRGLLEDVSNDGPTLLIAANRHLVKILKSKGYRVTYGELIALTK
jgi:hypothetical protein